MTFKLKHILNGLKIKYPSVKIKNEAGKLDSEVNGIRLFPLDTSRMRENILYINDASKGFPYDEHSRQFLNIMCVSDGAAEATCGEDIVYLISDLPYADMFNVVLNLYDELCTWGIELENLASTPCTIAQMTEAAKKIIDGEITVYDATFIKQSVFESQEGGDELAARLVPEEIKDPDFAKELAEKGLVTYTSKEVAGKCCMLMVDINGEAVAYCKLTREEEVFGDSHIDLLELFGEAIRKWYFEQKDGESWRGPLSSLAYDLLQGTEMSDDYLEERCRRIGFEPSSAFEVVRVSERGKGGDYRKYLEMVCKSIMNQTYVFSDNGTEYILFVLNSWGKEAWDEGKRKIGILSTYFAGNNLVCGVSRVFHDIRNLVYGKVQADFALEKPQLYDEINDSQIFYNYTDSGFEHMLQICEKVMPLRFFCDHSWFLMMFDPDKNFERYCEILKVYLENECDLTKSAQALHMHRNTLIYNIERLKTKYEIDLDDPVVRFNLRISMNIHEYLKIEDRR